MTDDQGRYLLPDLPKVEVQRLGSRLRPRRLRRRCRATRWRRPSTSRPSWRQTLPRPPSTIPAGYWFSLLKVPDKKEFPGTGPSGNGIGPGIKSQARLAERGQIRRVSGVSPIGEQRDAKDSSQSRQVPDIGARLGAAVTVRPGWRANDRGRSASWAASRRWRCSPTGRIGSPAANCRRRHLVPRGSSETS